MTRIAILGISAYYHDSAAAIIVDGTLVAAAQEERFTRVKHDLSFPKNAIQYVLEEAGISYDDLTTVVFYEKPLLKFERLLETFHAFAPRGISFFIKSTSEWMGSKLFMRATLKKELKAFGDKAIPLSFTEHHLSHAASAFYPSPFEAAAILTIDGVGEWATATISYGRGNTIKLLKELHFPHSVGLLYAGFTHYLGFRINSGEYKVMGLAPYGNSKGKAFENFRQKIISELVDIREDGSILLNMNYFAFGTTLTMTHDRRWHTLFGIPRRTPESEITQQHMDLALALQNVIETIVIALAKTAKEITNCSNLVMAGGVALNCVANSQLLRAAIFDKIWIQPASGDAGGAAGAAYASHYIAHGGERKICLPDAMNHAYLGPGYSEDEILRVSRRFQAPFHHFKDFSNLCNSASEKIANGSVIGWFQGRMEFGPRALGNRSILGDPRNPELHHKMNVDVKAREAFRPFAPSILEEDTGEYFKGESSSPYMLYVADLKEAHRCSIAAGEPTTRMYDRLYLRRSKFPAVTHVDYSSRLQTVNRESNPKFWELINSFKELTGCPMLINTSFNVRGEPMVCTPLDAYLAFMNTQMDFLVMGDYLYDKREQQPLEEKYKTMFEPD